ncbi:MAG TPA: NAD/NADP octopine/nopaline dehydrogenase family protein [Clostridia bacterium]|nr:NAD/NADP octopine/nopaline dehydrogenase family protein [Clostridia bacterium]
MISENKIAVLGAGNGGMAMAAYLSLKGYEVNLYDKFEKTIEGISRLGGIELDGVSLEGFAKMNLVTTELDKAVEGCEMLMFVTPAFAHRELAENMAPSLEDGQIIVLHPGRTCGALEVRHMITKVNPEVDVTVAEAQTLIYAARRHGENCATIHGVKKKVTLAAIPTCRTTLVIEKINRFYEAFIPAKNILETSLLNIGAIFHPGPAIFNIARIECKSDYEHYHEGITPCVGRILEKVDGERVAIAKKIKIDTISAKTWLGEVYGVKPEETLQETIRMNEVYAGISAPKDPGTRYISEDIPMSLTPLAELGKMVGVKTPYMDMLIDIASTMHGRDYRECGRNLKTLGIDNLSIDELLMEIQ